MNYNFINLKSNGETFLTKVEPNQNIVITTFDDNNAITSLTVNLTKETTSEFSLNVLRREFYKNGVNMMVIKYDFMYHQYNILHEVGDKMQYICPLPTCLNHLIKTGSQMEVYNTSVTNVEFHENESALVTFHFV